MQQKIEAKKKDFGFYRYVPTMLYSDLCLIRSQIVRI